MITVAPSRARLAAIASPIPAVEPVTRAVLFSNSRFMFFSTEMKNALPGCSHAIRMQNYALLQFSQMERPERRLSRLQQNKFLPDLENIQRKILARTVRRRANR